MTPRCRLGRVGNLSHNECPASPRPGSRLRRSGLLAGVHDGVGMLHQLIGAVRTSPAWLSMALLLGYGLHGRRLALSGDDDCLGIPAKS